MTKFIIVKGGALINVERIHKLYAANDLTEGYMFYAEIMEGKDIIEVVIEGPTLMPQDFSANEAILEFGLLITSAPQGVFIFNCPHLKNQRDARVAQQPDQPVKDEPKEAQIKKIKGIKR